MEGKWREATLLSVMEISGMVLFLIVMVSSPLRFPVLNIFFSVEPNEPELEVVVSGSVVTKVKPGDWVLVTCQARGGHPVADIGITMDGLPSGSKDFRNFKNSFTFEATENDNGKRILCTAVNKVGTSAASTILQVHSTF
jgi:hypothetical protein